MLLGRGTNYNSQIVCPPTVKTIVEKAFSSSTSIVNFKINRNLLNIEDRAFINSRYLVTFESPAECKLQTIGTSTFKNCTRLNTIYIPKSILYIGACAFENCKALTNIYYEGSESD
jgi:hypothetical protein